MFERRPDRLVSLVRLFAGITLLTASPSGAQVSAFSAQPGVVGAGTFHTIHYAFVVGGRGFAKGGGIRIEIPVAYAETEFLLWSPPQTDNPDSPGYVWATASNGAKLSVHIEGLLRGIVEGDFVDRVPAGTTVSIFYRGQVQGIAG